MQYLVAGVAVGRGEQVALPGLDETPADPRSWRHAAAPARRTQL